MADWYEDVNLAPGLNFSNSYFSYFGCVMYLGVFFFGSATLVVMKLAEGYRVNL